MKYIKEFEKLIKHDSIEAKNNIFKPLAEEFKLILQKLDKLDNLYNNKTQYGITSKTKPRVNIYYDDSKDITILYKYNWVSLLKIRLITFHRNDGIELLISLYSQRSSIVSYNKELIEIIKNILDKYDEEDDAIFRDDKFFIKLGDAKNLKILDNIISEINNEFDLMCATKNYNL